MNDTVIGIIGGMGPEATADFYLKIIQATRAQKDQDHFRVIIDGNAKIPDRTEAILGLGESPLEHLLDSARKLDVAKVDVACIPCITAHYFIDRVQEEVSYPVLNVIEEVCRRIEEEYAGTQKIGVLATTGVLKSQLLERYFDKSSLMYPASTTQEGKVMRAVYGEKGIKSGNKAGEPLQLLIEAGNELIESGAELLISGCTEIGMVLKPGMVECPLLDPMEIMAEAVVKEPLEVRDNLR